MQNVSKLVCNVIRDSLNLDKTPNNADTIDGLGADSLDTIDIMLTLEQTFDINIETDEMINAVTVEDVVQVVSTILGHNTNS